MLPRDKDPPCMTWSKQDPNADNSSWVFKINADESGKSGGHEFDGIPMLVPPNVSQEEAYEICNVRSFID